MILADGVDDVSGGVWLGCWLGLFPFGEVVHVEVGVAGFPFRGDVHGSGGDEADGGLLVGHDLGDAGSALDFPVDSFGAVVRA